MNRLPVIMDCDPGHDDAIGLVLAHASEALEILAVTTCCGNQTIEKTTENARRICTLIGLQAPVSMGAVRPLIEPPMNAPSVHGQSGLDGPKLPEPTTPISPLPAVSRMAECIAASREPVTIVATSPLTNIAALLLAHPEAKRNIRQISLMGGGLSHGNWTPAAEFNILVDPEAADIVFRSGIPLIMAGLDVTEQALLYPADFARIRALDNPVAQVVADWLEFFFGFHRALGYAGAPLHDPVATAVLLAPELFRIEECYVQIELSGQYCRGLTLADRMGKYSHAPNCRCITGLDREGFVSLLVRSIQKYGR